MREIPPPIQLLPAFEAAARLSSFKLAAHELNVTPSAISQQIKTLESLLEHDLFVRHPRAVELTRVGRLYFELTNDIITRYREGHRAINNELRTPTLRISAMTLVAYDILIPELPRFHLAHPEIDLRIETSEQLVELGTERDDVAVRIGTGDWPGLEKFKLCDLNINLVGNDKQHPLPTNFNSKKFKEVTLIHSRTHVDDWAEVARVLGLDLSNNPQVFFNDSFSAIAAAEAGSGVAIGLFPILQKRLNAKKVKALLPQAAPLDMSCWLVYPPALTQHPGLPAVKAWLTECFQKLT